MTTHPKNPLIDGKTTKATKAINAYQVLVQGVVPLVKCIKGGICKVGAY